MYTTICALSIPVRFTLKFAVSCAKFCFKISVFYLGLKAEVGLCRRKVKQQKARVKQQRPLRSPAEVAAQQRSRVKTTQKLKKEKHRLVGRSSSYNENKDFLVDYLNVNDPIVIYGRKYESCVDTILLFQLLTFEKYC
jgi:hypothetical protein